jgi:hypothetical protein
MKTFTISLPEDAVNVVERAAYELNTRQSVVDRYLDRHATDPDESAINSKPFVYFMSLLAEAEASFEIAKQEIQRNYIPEWLNGHAFDWNLEYMTKLITVTVNCDCDIPELDAYES